MKHPSLLSSVLAASITAFPPFARAAVFPAYTWTGGTGAWSDAARWSPNAVPGYLADVTIDGDSAVASHVTADAAGQTSQPLNSLQVGPGDRLDAAGIDLAWGDRLVVNGRLDITGGKDLIVGNRGLQGTGEIRFTSPGGRFERTSAANAYLDIPPGFVVRGPFMTGGSYPLSNRGTIAVTGGGNEVAVLPSPNPPSLNAGLIDVSNGAALALGHFTNEPGGVISVRDGATLRIGAGYLHGFRNFGRIVVSDASVTIDDDPFGDPPLLGGFTLTRTSVDNRGPAAIGLAATTGNVTILGQAATQPGSRVSLAVDAGATASEQLVVSGILDLTAPDDFLDILGVPAPSGLTYPLVLVTAASVVGTFDHVSPGFTVEYTSTSVILTPVPEPATLPAVVVVPALCQPRRRHR